MKRESHAVFTFFAVISAVSSITGFTLTTISATVNSYVLATVIFVVMFAVLYLGWRYFVERSVSSREEITKVNIRLIKSARKAVDSFSGDLSWAKDISAEIEDAAIRGVRFRIVCRDPIPPVAKQAVEQFLKHVNVEIRYFPHTLDPALRGLMIDPERAGRMFFVEKQLRNTGYGKQKANDYSYIGQHLSASTDPAIVAALNRFFDALWELSTEADLLEKIANSEVESHLRAIKQYSNASVHHGVVDINEIRPLHRYLDLHRLNSVASLTARMERHRISIHSPVRIRSSVSSRIVTPPLVEKHGSEFYLIDGLHRCYYLRQRKVREVAVFVIEGAEQPTPGLPWTWNDLVVLPEVNCSREDNFNQYKAENWRDLKVLSHRLITLSEAVPGN